MKPTFGRKPCPPYCRPQLVPAFIFAQLATIALSTALMLHPIAWLPTLGCSYLSWIAYNE
jgi:hypothetical protein